MRRISARKQSEGVRSCSWRVRFCIGARRRAALGLHERAYARERGCLCKWPKAQMKDCAYACEEANGQGRWRGVRVEGHSLLMCFS